jgi:hypothetical protein
VLLLSSCSSSLGKQTYLEVAVAVPQKPYELCYPKDNNKPIRSVSFLSKTDNQTYWEVDAPSKGDGKIKGFYIRMNFRTNQYGKCEFLDGSQPGNRLKYMPEDAAVALAKTHYQPFLTKFLAKCTIKSSKEKCLKEFADYFGKDESETAVLTILPEEDVKALKMMGVIVRPHVDEDPYLKIKKERSRD